MTHIGYISAIMLSAFCLGACATVVPEPDLPKDPATGLPTLETVTQRITCELAQTLYASDRNYKVLMSNDVDVAMQLSLTVNDTGSLMPSLTYLDLPTFSFNVGANLTKSREQNYFQKLYFSMRELDQEIRYRKQALGQDLTRNCPQVDTNLAGELGLRKSFELAMTSLDRLQWQDVKLSASDGSFGGYVNFAVTKNFNNVGPTWTLTHFKGPGGLAGISEVNTDRITFAFARGSQVGKPFNVIASARNPKAEQLLEQININQLTTQLNGLRQALQ